MDLESKVEQARKAGLHQAFINIQAAFVNFFANGLHMVEDIDDRAVKAIKEADVAIERNLKALFDKFPYLKEREEKKHQLDMAHTMTAEELQAVIPAHLQPPTGAMAQVEPAVGPTESSEGKTLPFPVN